MNMLIAYDIADPQRLTKIAKIMLDYGVRVQKSIFEVSLSGSAFSEMKKRVDDIIAVAEDGVKYLPLCEKCAGMVEIIGQGQFTDPDKEYYVY
jgi:CRISPR-associated protein Cas2